jgi:hypothetical protein
VGAANALDGGGRAQERLRLGLEFDGGEGRGGGWWGRGGGGGSVALFCCICLRESKRDGGGVWCVSVCGVVSFVAELEFHNMMD